MQNTRLLTVCKRKMHFSQNFLALSAMCCPHHDRTRVAWRQRLRFIPERCMLDCSFTFAVRFYRFKRSVRMSLPAPAAFPPFSLVVVPASAVLARRVASNPSVAFRDFWAFQTSIVRESCHDFTVEGPAVWPAGASPQSRVYPDRDPDARLAHRGQYRHVSAH